jgi:creatine kinase
MVDVTVLGSSGLPAKAYVSVRIGDTRRQAPCDGGQAFHFPSAMHQSMYVDVFQKVGSTQVSLDALHTEGNQVEDLSLMNADGQKIGVSFKLNKVEKSGPRPSSARETRHQAALRAKSYLDSNAIQNLLQKMVHNLLEQQPADPIEYMFSYLKDAKLTQADGAVRPVTTGAVVTQKANSPLPEKKAEPLQSAESVPPVQSKSDEQSAEPASQGPPAGLGPDDYPGFPADTCPDRLPDLSKHHSIMADIFRSDSEIFNRLKDIRTNSGVSFARCIKPGIDNRGHPMIKTVGAVAADEDSYTAFSEFFHKVVANMYPEFQLGTAQPTKMDASSIGDQSIDPEGKHVISCRLRVTRNVKNFPLTAAVSKMERREIERLVTKACLTFPAELQGDYFPMRNSMSYVPKIAGMSEAEELELQQNQLIFHEPDSTLMLSAGVGRDWPDARGIYLNRDRDLMVWVNYEDHLRLTSVENGGNLKSAFARLCKANEKLLESLVSDGAGFMQSDLLGYLCSCPSNLGTTLRATAAIRLPLLSARSDFKSICKELGLQARGGYNLEQSPRTGCWSVSNIVKMGLSEEQILKSFIDSCSKIVKMEKALEQNESIEQLLPVQPEAQRSKTEPIPSQPAEAQRSQTEPIPPRPTSASPELAWPQPTAPGLGDEPFPGFPIDKCSDVQPDLSRHHNAMAEVLQADTSIWPRLKDVVSESEVNLAMCVKPGVDNIGHPFIKTVGIVAGDEDSYRCFKDIFDPVIQSRHEGYATDAIHPTNLDSSMVKDVAIDPDGKYISSTRIRAGRNFRGVLLPPTISKLERREVERAVVMALTQCCDGEYCPLVGSTSYVPIPNGMTNDQEQTLEQEGLLFHEPDSALLLSSGMGRHWPDARGVFVTPKKDCGLWLNYEDHLSITTSTKGADIKGAFTKFSELEAKLKEALQVAEWEFMHNDHLGFITTCPSNLGTAMRVQVTVRVPLLSAHKDFKSICSQLSLSVRRKTGTGDEVLWEVMNSARLGISEVDIMNTLIEGVKVIIEMEKKLEAGEEVSAPDAKQAPAQEEAAPAPKPSEGIPISPRACTREFSGIPGLGESDYPGFDADACADTLPDLSGNHSVMAKVLKDDPAIWTRLHSETTDAGVTFGRCIKAGMDNPGHPMIKTVGWVAGDEESYSKFADLANPIISIMHNQFGSDGVHPINLDPDAINDVQIDSKYFVAAKISSGRNISGFCLPSTISKSDRRTIERLVTKGLLGLSPSLSQDAALEGDYYPLVTSSSYLPKRGGMTLDEEQMLKDKNVLFEEPDSKLLLASGMGRHWPDARGVFFSKQQDTVAWINEEDHVRMMVFEKGGSLKAAFSRFCKLDSSLQASLAEDGYDYMKSEHLGFIFSCPSNLGTGMRCSVQLRLPLLSEYLSFKQICKSLGLQARLLPESEAAALGDSSVYDMSNTAKLGTSEVDLVNSVLESCCRLIDMEKKLEASESIEDMLPKM